MSAFPVDPDAGLAIAEQRIEVTRKSSLISLDLSGLQLVEVPESLRRLSKLRYLFLQQNRLTRLPDWMAELRRLEVLTLGHNELFTLPEFLGSLRNLRLLRLDSNGISSIPESLAELPDACAVSLAGNPLAGGIMEIAELGWPVLRAFFLERARGSVPQWQIKLLLVGESGAGKTNLLRRLKEEHFQDASDPTPSLEIRDFELPHPTQEGVALNFRAWDFSGRDVYRATHQFFYSGEGVFLLVFNNRAGIHSSKLTSWLDRIRAAAPDSPVLLVGTGSENIEAKTPLEELRGKYPAIVSLIAVDNKSATGIDRLKEMIGIVAATLGQVGQPRPATWVLASEAITGTPEPYCELSRFQTIAETAGVIKHDAFAEHLRHTGQIAFLPSSKYLSDRSVKAEPAGWVVLKPDWLLQQFSAILTDSEIAHRGGVIGPGDPARIWPAVSPPVRELLLRLMDHFDLTYRTQSHPMQRIIVELSADDRPALVLPIWNSARGGDTITLEYRFKTAIPPGIPAWFIARTQQFAKPGWFWSPRRSHVR